MLTGEEGVRNGNWWRFTIISFAVVLSLLVVGQAGADSPSGAENIAQTNNMPIAPESFLSAGGYHTCALKGDGEVVCWGAIATPPTGSFIQIDTGEFHTCGLRIGGSVECWGDDSLGQATDQIGPFTQIAAGYNHNCGLKADGSVECWGGNNEWGEADAQDGPFTQITAGVLHTCGLKSDGVVYCWGMGKYGQADVPEDNFKQISSGEFHTCGVNLNQDIRCWGFEEFGEAPDVVSGDFVQVSAGHKHACGLVDDGSVVCWGLNGSGQTDAPEETRFREISGGGAHTCGLKRSGEVECWGDNIGGQANSQDGPFGLVIQPPASAYFSAGGSHTCALEIDGSIACWGANEYGQSSPPAGSFTQVSAGGDHTCGLRPNGDVECWGDNSLHQATNWSGPHSQIATGLNYNCVLNPRGGVECWAGDNDWGEVWDQTGPFVQVVSGTNHNCGLKPDGGIFCWGANHYGQTDHPEGMFNQLSAGWDHTCGVKTDGSIVCWGKNYDGQTSAPAGHFVKVSAGSYHSCGLKADGSAVCWGLNSSGQTDSPASRFRQISAGGAHTCGLKRFGSIECWGDNDQGQATDQDGPYGQLVGPPIAVDDRYHTDRDDTLYVGAPGVLSNDTNASGDPHVYYVAEDQHVYVMAWFDDRWSYFDVTGFTGAPDVAGDVLAATTVGGDPRVYYLTADQHVHELAWTNGAQQHNWYHRDLTLDTGAPLAVDNSALAATIVNASPRVYYLTTDQHIHELAWIEDGWHHNDVTESANATPANVNSPLGATTTANGDPRVFYIAGSAEIYELAWNGDRWFHWNVMAETDGPPVAAGALGVTTAGLDPRVYYLTLVHAPFDTGDALEIQELGWYGSEWHQGYLGGWPWLAEDNSALSVLTIADSGEPRVYYTDYGQRVHEFAWFDDTWHFSSLTNITGAPRTAIGSPLSATTAHLDPRVYYLMEDGHVQELAWVVDAWSTRDLMDDLVGAPLVGNFSALSATTANIDPISSELVSDVAHGVLELLADGSFIYTPDAGYEGLDSFTYRANDGWAYSEDVTVMITVAPPAVAIDIEIALYNTPTTTEARAPYERIIGYFADGLYESSNGARKLGTVTFRPNSDQASAADIVWDENCNPRAHMSCNNRSGCYVYMCDIFTAKDYDFLSDDTHQTGGGYMLTHLWGRYYFGLADEFPYYDGDMAVPNSIMNDPWRAIDGDFNWLNFSVAKNFNTENQQYRNYRVSGWDTLARPESADPRDEYWRGFPVRRAYRDLQDAAPEIDEDSPIELPGTARSELQIVWENPDPARTAGGMAAEGSYMGQLTSLLGPSISYPEPMLLVASVQGEFPLTSVGVNGTMQSPNGREIPIEFADDGHPPDALKDDGLYSMIFSYDVGGVYTITVQFDNEAGTAMMVSSAFDPVVGPDGKVVPLPAAVPVSEAFTASATMNVIVSNVVADDYGDTPASAKSTTANNESLTGKIESTGDTDVFRFKTLENGTTYVRVTNLALGMSPRLRVLGPDGTEALFDATFAPSYRYLFIPLTDVAPGATLYAEISDASEVASGGLYEFSAGAKLASDLLALEALFSATPLTGISPLNVTFTDTSIGSIASWLWEFGDGATSTAQNPSHTYANVGTYTVALTVSGPDGNDTLTRTDYINVTADTGLFDYQVYLSVILQNE